MKRSPLLVAVLLILIGTTPVQSQDSLYTLTAYVGVGFTRNFSEFAAPVQGLDQNGFTGSIRVMWKPEHLLRV